MFFKTSHACMGLIWYSGLCNFIPKQCIREQHTHSFALPQRTWRTGHIARPCPPMTGWEQTAVSVLWKVLWVVQTGPPCPRPTCTLPRPFPLGGSSYAPLSSQWKSVDSIGGQLSKIWVLVPSLQFGNSLSFGNLTWTFVSSCNEIWWDGEGPISCVPWVLSGATCTLPDTE